MPSLESAIHDAPRSVEILGGEPILGAAITSPPPHDPRSPANALSLHLGAVGGVLELAKRADKRQPLPFSLRGALAIAVTPTRFLFWTYEGILRLKPRLFLGEVAVADVEKVELSRRRGKLAFWLRSGTTVELDVKDKDIGIARAFTDVACERILMKVSCPQ